MNDDPREKMSPRTAHIVDELKRLDPESLRHVLNHTYNLMVKKSDPDRIVKYEVFIEVPQTMVMEVKKSLPHEEKMQKARELAYNEYGHVAEVLDIAEFENQ